MKKIDNKTIISVVTAVLMTAFVVILYQASFALPQMQFSVLSTDRNPWRMSSDDSLQIYDAEDDTSAENGAEPENDFDSEADVYPDAISERLEADVYPDAISEREVVIVAFISPVVFDSVDIFIWRTFQHLSESFDMDIRPFNTNYDASREKSEIRNAIRDGFDVIIIHPSHPEDIIPALKEAHDAGLVIGTMIDDLPQEFYEYRHFFVPFAGNHSGLTDFPDSTENMSVQTDLMRMVLYTLRSTRSVLDHGYVIPHLVRPNQ